LTGWEVVTVIVAQHLEADVAVRIAPQVWPDGVGRKTHRIRISGARSGTTTAVHPVRLFRSGMDGHDFGRETRSRSDLPPGSVGACRVQREHRSNCRDQLCVIERIQSEKIPHELAPLSVSSTYEGKGGRRQQRSGSPFRMAIRAHPCGPRRRGPRSIPTKTWNRPALARFQPRGQPTVAPGHPLRFRCDPIPALQPPLAQTGTDGAGGFLPDG